MEKIFIILLIISLNDLCKCEYQSSYYPNYPNNVPMSAYVQINDVMPAINRNIPNFETPPKLSIQTVESGDCKDPNTVQLTIEQMCSLPPNRGHGRKDIVRIYYNPVLQQCLPFSWSGKGGNSNRFGSIKNCYEICHPSDPGVTKLTGSGIRPYLAKRRPPKYCSDDRDGIPELGIKPIHKKRAKAMAQDVVIRQINNPLNPSKTLTLVQPVRYVAESQTSPPEPTERAKVIIEKRVRHVPVMYPTPQQTQPIRMAVY